MATLTLEDLIEAGRRAVPLSRGKVEQVVRGTLAEISGELVTGRMVKISRFAAFIVRRKRARMGRNPKRPQEQHEIPARRVVVVRYARDLVERINNRSRSPDHDVVRPVRCRARRADRRDGG